MHFTFNSYKRNQQSRQSSVNSSIPNRFSFSGYSNLGYISTAYLAADIPCIYSIKQEYQSENDTDVIIKFIEIFNLLFIYLV